MPETRKHERLPISLRVRFRSATLDEFIEKYAQNISYGGLFIQSRTPMPVGTLIKFEFRLTDESKVISGVGRIVWSRDDDDNDNAPTGMGVKFIKVDPENRERITEIVDRRGGGEGIFEEQEGTSLSEPPLMPTVPPKGLASGSNPPPSAAVRHPNLHGLSDSDSIHAPVKDGDTNGQKAPREARPSLAAALMSTEEAEPPVIARSESMPAGLAPDDTEDDATLPASVRPDVDIVSPPTPEPPVIFSEPPTPSSPPTSKQPLVTGKAMDPVPDPGVLATIEDGTSASAPPGAEPKSGVAAIESALADSLDDALGAASPSQPALLGAAQESAFGIGVADIADESASDRPLSTPSESGPPQEKQSRLQPMILALVLIALVGAMLFFALNQGWLDGALGSSANMNSRDTANNQIDTPQKNIATPATPVATNDVGGDSGASEGGANDVSADVNTDTGEGLTQEKDNTAEDTAQQDLSATDVKPIKVRFASNVRGTQFSFNGTTFDQSVELPPGEEVLIQANAPGYKTTDHRFVPGPKETRQRITLEPLPHVLKITSTPPGAAVSMAGKNASTPAEFVFEGRPKTNFVIASLPGHLRARVRINPKAFEQVGERMEQSIAVKLRPRPKHRPRPAGGGSDEGSSSDESGSETSDSSGSSSSSSAGDVPDNPF